MTSPIDMNTQMFNLQGKKLESFTQAVNSSKNDQDDRLKKAANDFESVFVSQFLQTLDSTVEKSEFMHGGQAEDTFKSMLNQEIAKNISSSPTTSFGLAAQIYKQLKSKIEHS